MNFEGYILAYVLHVDAGNCTLGIANGTPSGVSFSHSSGQTMFSNGIINQDKERQKLNHVSLNRRGNTSWTLMSRITGSLHRYEDIEAPYIEQCWQ